MVAATAVGEDFNAVEAPTFRSANKECLKNPPQPFSHFYMRTVGRKELLASLGSQASVNSREDHIANRHLAAALQLLDPGREEVLLDVSRGLPRGEEAHFAKVAIVGHEQLGTEAENLAVEDNGARIVPAIAVEEGQADVNHDAVQGLVGQDGLERVPRILIHFILEKMIQAAVACNLELGADAQGCAGGFGLVDALLDAA